MKFMTRISLLLAFAAFWLSSCKTENIVANNYLYKMNDSTGRMVLNVPQPVIQKEDLLHIRVFSQSVVPETDLPYNLPEPTSASASTIGVSGTSGFLVDHNGNIEYPQVGTLQVEGLTREQVAEQIRQRLDTSLTNPSVIVRFLNYKVTVLGEVKTPLSFTAPTERVTLLEALGMAGDVTEFGDKTRVRVARENNGVVEVGMVDLTSPDFFTSPYFRLKQNDVVFVEQTQRKVKQEERTSVAQQIGIVSGVVTGIALILNLIK